MTLTKQLQNLLYSYSKRINVGDILRIKRVNE